MAFWTAYALTLTETVGATMLALLIAVAGIGPLAGVMILFLAGRSPPSAPQNGSQPANATS